MTTLYKGVNDDYLSDHGMSYRPGEKPSAPDWTPVNACGGGLHFSPHPQMTHTYCSPIRYVAVKVRAKDIVPIGDRYFADKCKAPSCVVLYECDVNGAELAVEAVTA